MTITWPEDDDAFGHVRTPYSVNWFGRRDIAQIVAFGRSIGLEVVDHHDGGWLVRAGYLVAKGKARDLRRFARAIDALR